MYWKGVMGNNGHVLLKSVDLHHVENSAYSSHQEE